LQSLFLKIDVTEIVVHKTDQPNTVVDLFDAYGGESKVGFGFAEGEGFFYEGAEFVE
jgi:hypothetical protein